MLQKWPLAYKNKKLPQAQSHKRQKPKNKPVTSPDGKTALIAANMKDNMAIYVYMLK